LQPIGSFKLRGAANAMQILPGEQLAEGVFTASAGNMAQGVAWNARRLGIPCTVVVPDHAPETKLTAVRRLGGTIIRVPFDEWWEILTSRKCDNCKGVFIHPVSDPSVIAGNGTIGLEILEDFPDVDAVVIPYGGGGLSSGIASAIRSLKPQTRIYACEVETACPLALSLQAGEPRKVSYTASFVDGIGGKSLLTEMWPMVRDLLEGSLVMSLAEVAAAVRLLAERNRVIAEGAGATPVAAALSGKAGGGKVVCVVSGGNIDLAVLTRILAGEVP
jgi:threonine dehydratase